MARNLDTGLLRTFVTIAETASMTAVASALQLTQGAVSQQIRRLEEAFGCRLFDRKRRGLRLTLPGERLLGRARRVLSLNDEIWAEMTTDTVVGRVRLGVPNDLLGNRLSSVLKAYADTFPQVDVSLMCGSSPELAGALASGKVDLAIIERPAGLAGGECLNVQPLVWVGARAGSAHLKRPLPISMVADTCAFRPAVLAALREHELPWRTVFENCGMEATSAIVRVDLAVTVWLASTVPRGLDILPAGSGLPTLPNFAISLHLPGHQAGTAVTEFARYIRASHRTLQNPTDPAPAD